MQFTENSFQNYDEIYAEAWRVVSAEHERLQNFKDHERTLEANNAEDFYKELEKVEKQCQHQTSHHIIRSLYPTLQHYQDFFEYSANTMTDKVDILIYWGLLYLVIKSAGTIVHTSKMLENIGHALRQINDCTLSVPEQPQSNGNAMEVNRVMMLFWLRIISLFRNQKLDETNPDRIFDLISLYDTATKAITHAISDFEKAAKALERQVRIADSEICQKTLEPEKEAHQTGQLPCHLLPVAANKRFYGRENYLTEIDAHLKPDEVGGGLRSMAIHGLGGVGKTQIALAYAHRKREDLDATFWVSAESTLTIQQGFSEIACEALKLSTADPNSPSKNMAMVMIWLQQTRARWLLIYDNVESHDALKNSWPAADRGAILITTRNLSIVSQPIDKGLEIQEFAEADGAQLFIRLLIQANRPESDESAALKVSRELGGHALAISQMAAYINARSELTIEKFLNLYQNYPRQFRRKKKPSWEYMGYKYGLDTVWKVSFEYLSNEAFARLGVLSFLRPNAIPMCLLEDIEIPDMLDGLEFLEDEMSHDDMIKQLTSTALVRLDSESNTLSLHRLVQAETRFRMDINERQRAFDGATKSVLKQFPDRGSMLTRDHSWEEAGHYLQHIRFLAQQWLSSQRGSKSLRPTVDFCNLMANAAWFVRDADTTGVMSIVVNTSFEAFKKLPDHEYQANQLLYCDLLQLGACFHLKHGDFPKSEQLSRSAYLVRADLDKCHDRTDDLSADKITSAQQETTTAQSSITKQENA